MRLLKGSITLGCILGLLFFLPGGRAVAQRKSSANVESNTAPFALNNGDRVVFLGNSVFENDFQYGYLELALTTRWPDCDVTYRNLGWTGDDVFGVARSTITNPPTGYELLMEHLTKTQPTLVFIAYGGVEAQAGEDGLPTFVEGLTKLLDKTDQLGAKAILLSPIPILSADSVQSQSARNAMLERYSAAIARIAAERGKRYIDLYKPIQTISKQVKLTDNGIHLNETGYYYLATTLEKGLELPPRFKPVDIRVATNAAEVSGSIKRLDSGSNSTNLTFTIDEDHLPLPLPTDDEGITDKGQMLTITGLKKGFYTLMMNDMTLVTASAKNWEKGINIQQGSALVQSRELRQMILKKNDLFFFQYRPLNTTYILGFRSYEQGRHVKDLEEQNILIKWLESQIALNRSPRPTVYQLIPLK